MSTRPPIEVSQPQQSPVTEPQKHLFVEAEPPEAQKPKQYTCMDIATYIIDNANHSLYSQILEGRQAMNRRKAFPTIEPLENNKKKKSIIVEPAIDIDQHKRLVRKFKHLSKKFQMARQQRSLRLIEATKNEEEEYQKKKNEERSKTLELRREQIAERLKKKEELMKQIKRAALQTTQKFQAVKNRKTLFQEKEEAFKKQYVLPKIEEQRRILNKLKEERRPLDLTLLFEHQKRYEQKLKADKVNRSLTSRVLQIENHYDPPKYVPKSYQIMQAEEALKREEQKMKVQESEINLYRKREFLRMIEEKQKNQKSLQKSQQIKSKKSQSALDSGTVKPKAKVVVQLNRAQMKHKGDEYLKDLVKFNRSRRKKSSIEIKNKTEMAQYSTIQQRKPKTQYEIELIKEQQIERREKIKIKVLNSILHDDKIDDAFKLQKLKHQNEKIDQILSKQTQKLNKLQRDEIASLYLSSIHTKLAILNVSSPKKQD